MRVGILGCLVVPLAAGVLLAQGGPAPAPPSQPPTPPQTSQPTFRTGIGLVRVDVTVSGRDDRPVDDLTAEEFEVREDGELQTIESLQFVRLTGRQAPDDDSSLEIRSPEHAAAEAARDDVRLLVIFIDDYHLRNGALHDYRLKRMMRQFVDAEMRETDLFAVMGPLTPMDDLGLTRNKQDLFDRIERVEGRLGGFVAPRSALEESQMYLGPMQRARVRVQVTLTALEALANYLGALREGRKSVLFVSEGPPLQVDRDSMFDHIRDVITAANRNNVTINTLDPRELGESSSFVSTANDALSLDTGGRRLSQSNDYSKGLRAVLADASAYYLLGYAPKRPVEDGKFHAIEVKVRRKGVRVLARKGYWAPMPVEMRPPPAPTAPADVTGALERITPRRRDRALEWWLGFDRGPDGSTRATFSWERPDGGGADAARGVATRVSIDVGEGLALEKHMGVADRSKPEGPWQIVFLTRPGKQALRVRAEDDEGGALDEWTERVVVPDLAAVDPLLGTLRLYRAATPAAWRTLSANLDDAAPIASRRLRRTDRALVAIPLSAGATDADLRAELLSTQGKRLVTLNVSRAAADATPRVELPLASLAQAQYVLRVAAERVGHEPVSQALGFVVVP